MYRHKTNIIIFFLNVLLHSTLKHSITSNVAFLRGGDDGRLGTQLGAFSCLPNFIADI